MGNCLVLQQLIPLKKRRKNALESTLSRAVRQTQTLNQQKDHLQLEIRDKSNRLSQLRQQIPSLTAEELKLKRSLQQKQQTGKDLLLKINSLRQKQKHLLKQLEQFKRKEKAIQSQVSSENSDNNRRILRQREQIIRQREYLIKEFQNQLIQKDKRISLIKADIKEKEKQKTMIIKNYYKIELTLYDGSQINIFIPGQKIIKDLKQNIFQKYNDQLQPSLMAILHQSSFIEQNKSLLQLSKDEIIKLKQTKAQVWELEGFQSDKTKIDQISGEAGVAFLKCGHFISRAGLLGAIAYQTETLKQDFISCLALNKNGDCCNERLQIYSCQLIGGYAKDQWNLIQQKLSQNYARKYTTQCPSCYNSIRLQGIQSKKMHCIVCKVIFCFQCGQEWKQQSKSFCQSQQCLTIKNLIANAPWTRVFKMNNQTNGGNKFDVKVPNVRACPAFKCLIMNTNNCKHTLCPCGINFCFVCLQKKQKDKWKCGGAYHYCGKIAPNQTMNQLK